MSSRMSHPPAHRKTRDERGTTSNLVIASGRYFLCVIFLAVCSQAAAQQPAHCAQNLFCLFNQEARATDPVGIHEYSHDLIELIAPPETGKSYIDSLVNRLAGDEQSARAQKGKLVPEADVARAFNELMSEIGAPLSLKTDEATVQRFREHAASIRAFPELLTAGRNGRKCNPGEAVFLLYLLLSNSGHLFEQNLDSAQALTRTNTHEAVSGYGVAHMVAPSTSTSRLSSYLSRHNRSATMAIFNKLAATLGF